MRPSRWIAVLALAAVAAVSGVRAASLAGGGSPLTARGEVRWFGWAYRGPEVPRLLTAARAELRPGEPVVLVAPPHRWELRWLRVMARYHLPENELAGVYRRGAVPAPPPGAAVVALSWNGRVTVHRPGGEAP